MHKLISIFAATALLGCASVADAGYLADVTVINRTTGARLETYRNGGRLYIEGRAGDRYSVEIRNRSGSRILGVLSVDGVNVVSGQTAATSQTGYVLDARERAEIAGWRKDLSEVASLFHATPRLLCSAYWTTGERWGDRACCLQRGCCGASTRLD